MSNIYGCYLGKHTYHWQCQLFDNQSDATDWCLDSGSTHTRLICKPQMIPEFTIPYYLAYQFQYGVKIIPQSNEHVQFSHGFKNKDL